MTTASLSNQELPALDPSALDADLTQISLLLLKKGHLLATAESCSGGLIAAACTDLAGSSQWFERGFVTYSNAAKVEMLGVPAAMIDQEGAVSEAVRDRYAVEGAERADGQARHEALRVTWRISALAASHTGQASAELRSQGAAPCE